MYHASSQEKVSKRTDKSNEQISQCFKRELPKVASTGKYRRRSRKILKFVKIQQNGELFLISYRIFVMWHSFVSKSKWGADDRRLFYVAYKFIKWSHAYNNILNGSTSTQEAPRSLASTSWHWIVRLNITWCAKHLGKQQLCNIQRLFMHFTSILISDREIPKA